MKTRYRCKVLIVGLATSWLLGFFIFLFQQIVLRGISISLWLILAADILIWLYKSELDKIKDDSQIELIEQFFWVANLITVLFSFGCVLLALNSFWFVAGTKYAFFALGTPSLIAIIYGNVIKNYHSESPK